MNRREEIICLEFNKNFNLKFDLDKGIDWQHI